MSMATTAVLVTPEEYLTQEELAEEKSEYEDGVIIPMPGATELHILIMMNVQFLLYAGTRGQDFRVYNSEMRVRTPDSSRYTYPDVAVVAGQPQFDPAWETAILPNPCLIVEVLSKSTQERDKGTKFAGYKLIPTMQEYLLIDQYTVQVTQWVLDPEQGWQSTEYSNLDDGVQLVSVLIHLPLHEIYTGVTFA